MSAPPHLRLTALAITIGIVFTVFAPAGVGVAAAGNEPVANAGNQGLGVGIQQGAGSVTVSVSQNGTAVENATVRVTANNTYAGTGEYMTDTDGSVSLPVPNETVMVEITAEAGNQTGTANATLHANAGKGPAFIPMGQRIAAFVHGLQQTGGVVKIGPAMADYVTALAPAGGPPTTGPPPWASDVGNRGGPPDHAVNDARGGDRGPPEHAGPPDETDNTSGSDARSAGPPAHAGPNATDESQRSNAASDSTTDDNENDRGPGNDNKARGPPKENDDDDDDEADDNSTSDNSGNGPPDDRGKGNGR